MRKTTLALTTLALLMCTATYAASGPTLTERNLLRGKLTLLVPQSFTQMSKEMLRYKYPNERRPTTVLTNADGTVNVAVNHTHNNLRMAQLHEAHAAMERMLRNSYPSAKWNRSEIVSINGQQFFILDLRTPAIDTEVRNIMAGTSLQGRFLIITFNCTRELESEWAGVGLRIINSVSLSH